MSAKVDQFCESLRVKLNKMESQLDGVKSDLKVAQQEDKEGFQSMLKEARLSVETRKLEVKAAQAKAENWLKAKEEAGAAVIQGWKDQFEKSKLERHADRAEENAEAAIYFAEAAIADAVVATYEAIDARMAADQVDEA